MTGPCKGKFPAKPVIVSLHLNVEFTELTQADTWRAERGDMRGLV